VNGYNSINYRLISSDLFFQINRATGAFVSVRGKCLTAEEQSDSNDKYVSRYCTIFASQFNLFEKLATSARSLCMPGFSLAVLCAAVYPFVYKLKFMSLKL